MSEINRTIPDRVDELEATMVQNLPPVECPVSHLFTDGMYIREIFMPAGALVTSKIHKTEHPFVVSKGSLLIRVNDEEWVKVSAPYTGITKPGTRRVAYILEDTVWTTFHTNPENLRDLDEVEDMVIEKHDNPLLINKDTKEIEL